MPRILVVEDEENIALGLRGDLELEGYEVTVIDDGIEALKRAQSETYELILLDVMLPGKDGYEICRELRKNGSSVPIILVTAKTQEAEVILGLELGADDYITKPFSPMELRARIRAVLRRSHGDDMHLYRFGEFEVDLKRIEVRYKGNPLRLTPIEFKILSTFVRHPGQVLDRDRLLDLVWGKDVFVTDRVVDTHITNLRKKLCCDEESGSYIVSVRGVGYRFDG